MALLREDFKLQIWKTVINPVVKAPPQNRTEFFLANKKAVFYPINKSVFLFCSLHAILMTKSEILN